MTILTPGSCCLTQALVAWSCPVIDAAVCLMNVTCSPLSCSIPWHDEGLVQSHQVELPSCIAGKPFDWENASFRLMAKHQSLWIALVDSGLQSACSAAGFQSIA